MIHASLFSGIGGPEIAATMMGWENAFHCEINPFCRAVLEYWFPDSISYEDVTKTSFKEWRGRIDVLTGGFPCQPFSYAGKRGGETDERYLWPEMLRAIDEIRPTWVVGENVAGIATMVEGGRIYDLGCVNTLFDTSNDIRRYRFEQSFTIERVCKELEEIGYSVQPILVPAACVNAPHRRERIFIVANADGCNDCGKPGKDAGTCEKERLQEWNKIWQSGKPNNVSAGIFTSSSDTNGAGRKEPVKRDRKTIGTENETGLDDRIERSGGDGNVADALRTRCAGKDESGDSQGKKRMHLWGNINGCDRSDLLPENRWKYNKKGEWLPTVPAIHRGNDGIPIRLDNLSISFAKWRNESLKAYGNAIVPQVMFRIFEAIEFAGSKN